ncbi:eCIS core domain-containing protein [Draconibacterium halophilum]|uniref:DUF4157 domain-containing protein n=1 Tax=Draconibacterium halophilum TaxID=2706887 RepID=A0A6C0RF52_9BACT|nr:DUF4157 domain-containing protein [Draconibacterium halophilum]QIA08472.1 DUF4157 domain-containing protein [Draconibacterium halophilum]
MSGNRSSKEYKPSAALANRAQPFIQPSLKVGQPGDKYEKEADQMADQILENGKAHPGQENAFFSPVNPVQLKTETASDSLFQPSVEQGVEKVEEEETQLKLKPESEFQNRQDQSFLVEAKPANTVVQTNPETEDELQKQEEEEEAVQAKEFVQKSAGLPEEEKDNDPIQTKSDQPGDVSSIESSLSSATRGNTLDNATRSEMESGFDADFSDVKVHTGNEAVQMSENINAQAFTHGNDIYFNEGKYNPGSDSGKHLLAHELTHTVQQGASLQRKMIQKEENEENTTTTENTNNEAEQSTGSLSTGIVDNTNRTITYESIPVTAFKLTDHRAAKYNSFNLRRASNYSGSRQRNNVNQLNIWRDEVDTDEIETKLTDKYNQAAGVESSRSGRFDIYAFKVQDSERGYITGTMNNIVREAAIPKWNDKGESPAYMQVDHIVEMQISGFSDENADGHPVNDISNMELLNAGENRQSGEIIRESVENKVENTIDDEDAHSAIVERLPSIEEQENKQDKISLVKSNYDLVFNSAVPGGGPSAITSDKFWTQNQIESGDQLNQLVPVNMSELGAEDNILVFPRKYHPIATPFRWNGSNTNPRRNERNYFSPWRVVRKEFFNNPESEILGHFDLEFPDNDPVIRATGGQVEIKKLPGAQFAGYVDNVEGISASRHAIISAGNIAAKQFSPIRLDTINFNDNGVVIDGKVLPTLGFIENAEIDLHIENGEILLSKTFVSNDLDLPAPFVLENSSLTIFASSERGLGISGRVDFGINNVGEGHIGAAASTSGGFELEGAFNFDSELFDPAEINVEYRENTWTIGGEIGIPEGKVRGIKSATITASYSENNFSASGDAELDIPGIEQGTLEVEYSDEGFSVGGEFNLSSEIPGISGGNVSATVAKEEGEEGYSISISGSAQPDIPGIDSELSVSYENGALTIEGSAGYERGMLSGNVRVGATNRTIDEEGQPTGEPDGTMRVYGGGDLTLQLTPWLEATAGVEFLPNGEMEVSGRIRLPSAVDVFDRREFNRNLFSVPTIEIPIFAIPLGPRSIGLVAQISGGLDFSAGFGPGQLREVYAEVTYNPDHEDETEIHGHGEFAVPADAGLTLRGDLGLGVSVAIASLSGGIELAGTLGLEGEASAMVDLSWSPQTGVVLDAEGRIMVNPQFTFDVNAFARASLGIGWFSISETWRHNLVSFSWGPDIQFGVVFPVHYQEDQPFDISFDDIEVIYPDLDVVDMAKELAGDIKDDIFD